MPTTMAVTQAQIDALNDAIADGVRQVTIDGHTTTYNTTDSLIRARDDLVIQLQRAERKQRTRTLVHYAGRGYNDGDC